MKKLIIAAVACLATFVVEAAPNVGRQQAARPAGGAPRTQRTGSAKTASKPAAQRGGASRSHDCRSGHRDRMNKQDQALLDRIEEANSTRELCRYIQAAAASREEDVRAAMVDALESADDHSPSDFVYFIADPSEDVADAAFTAWSSALEDAKGHRRVRAIIEAGQMLQGVGGGSRQVQPPPPATQPVVVPAAQPVVVPIAQPVAY